MRVILAQPRGFCAGVVRAIDIVQMLFQRLRPFFDRELHEDVLDVRLYCFRSDTQFQCDLFVRSALADLLENVALARTQGLRNGRSRVCGQTRLMDFRDLLYSVQERVASIRFNRPARQMR